ncbi:ATP-binding cassette domain-containing protein [Patescibacteria group bacterium]|nr:ATP-binding cassette domain-containing protein [Patescibacteria group bacterium]MDE1946742.1 ATP-binding cassette domain-containing protein [Patescibacteria group bacterium]MDE2010955.1 ATP-binding cassette domain-containing protein [Patescibacteria group bacterium]MDE2233556.1 ATP-binding cassette domain-containing protein [Patescibacteria group bacterium]
MIYYDKVTKVYPDKSIALEEVTFGVEPKEFVTIVGHSGAGKTTLMKLLIAEERPSGGAVFFESSNIHRLGKRDMSKIRRRIGTIFQDYRLIPTRTVYENISFAMEAAGRGDGEIAADVPHVLELVNLGHKIWNFPRELSGGERQRVAIARAIVNQPDIVIADEPTGNLDPENTFEIVRILRKINELGTTVLLTTHNKGVVDTVGGRIITMERGRVVKDDKNGRYVL